MWVGLLWVFFCVSIYYGKRGDLWQYGRVEILQQVWRRVLSGSAFCGRPPLWRMSPPLRFSLLWKASPLRLTAVVISLLLLCHAICLPTAGFWLELRSWPWHEPIEAKSIRGFARSLDTSLWKPKEDTAVATPFSLLQQKLQLKASLVPMIRAV